MKFEPRLEAATLVKRYKRFLADITLPDGSERTIHCANTGAMTGCADTGNTVWYSTSDNPKRKYPNSWELSETAAGHKICINTARANQLAVEAIESGVIEELQGYDQLQTEVKYGSENSRIDILLNSKSRPNCYIEVKSVTLLDDHVEGQGYFPDAVTTRGQKHLQELMLMKDQGHRTVVLYIAQRTDAKAFRVASQIDPEYASLTLDALKKGVEFYCYGCGITDTGITIEKPIPIQK